MPRNWFEFVKIAQTRDQEHWNDVGRYGVSKIHGCQQKAWFEILGKHTETYQQIYEDKKVFFVGTAVHEMIQNYAVEQFGAIKEREVHYKDVQGRFEIRSYVDLIFPDDGVVDIKTTWSKPENWSPESAIHQVNFYMGLTGIKIGGILAISLANIFGNFAKEDIWFIPHVFDQKMFENDLQGCVELTDCLIKRTPPKKYERTYCKYCQYSMMCPDQVKEKDRDKIYENYWKIFYQELADEPKRKAEQEKKKRDAISDGYAPVDQPIEEQLFEWRSEEQ